MKLLIAKLVKGAIIAVTILIGLAFFIAMCIIAATGNAGAVGVVAMVVIFGGVYACAWAEDVIKAAKRDEERKEHEHPTTDR